MPSNQPPAVKKPDELAPEARQILRTAIKVSLATNDRKKTWPFLSLTSVATTIEGTPILLLSNIAHHTRNIMVDPHISLLFDNTPAEGRPLEHGRITLHGILKKDNAADIERRFMARHPEAFYAQFADFDFYRLDMKAAHYVAGFGATTTLSPHHILLRSESARLKTAEPTLLEELNHKHRQTIGHMGDQCHYQETGNHLEADQWRLMALDPEGCDLMHDETIRVRYSFSKQAQTVAFIKQYFEAITLK